jgi:hypothetical protein
MVVLNPRETNRQVNKLPSLKNFHPAFATIVDNPDIMPINAQTLGTTRSIRRGKAPK